MNIHDLKLIEELAESDAEVMLTKLARQEYVAGSEGIDKHQPILYTIKYKEEGGLAEFYVVAHGWSWEGRHKNFYVHTSNGGKRSVGSFYCSVDNFISQHSRPVTDC